AEDGIRDWSVTGVQTCALPICPNQFVARFDTDASAVSVLVNKRGPFFVLALATAQTEAAIIRDGDSTEPGQLPANRGRIRARRDQELGFQLSSGRRVTQIDPRVELAIPEPTERRKRARPES